MKLRSLVDPEREANSAFSDAVLPGINLLRRPTELVPILSCLLVGWLGPEGRLTDCRTDVRRYVPGKRCVVEFQLDIELKEGGGVESRKLIGKIYANGQGQKVYETLLELWNRGFGTRRLTVTQPLAYDPNLQLLLLGHSKGELLRNLILTESDLCSALEGAAEWLSKLHRCGLTAGRRYSLDDHLHTLKVQKQSLEPVYPDAAQCFSDILVRIERQAGDMQEWKPGPTHRDFSPDHLLVDGNQITGLDFDEFCQYDSLFDVAHFIAHLGYLGLRHFGSLRAFDALAEHFFAAYQSCAYNNHPLPPVELYLALAYLKLAQVTALVTRPSNWQQATDILLAESQRFCSEK